MHFNLNTKQIRAFELHQAECQKLSNKGRLNKRAIIVIELHKSIATHTCHSLIGKSYLFKTGTHLAPEHIIEVKVLLFDIRKLTNAPSLG